MTSQWGIPYQDQDTWGLDPYYYSNGTITAGTSGIMAGARQQLAYLLGGHDAGLGATAALNAYLLTQDERYLESFKTYYGYFQRSQLSPLNTSAITITNVNGRNITANDAGFFAEQATVSAGRDGVYGTPDDSTKLEAVYRAGEHGNPIALALIFYCKLTHDETAMTMLNRYGNWLVRIQIKSGNFSGAFPVSQHYLEIGWKPRMYETAESAWILSELYSITDNDTYLSAAVAAGKYMVSRQYQTPADPHVIGSLPYEWNETKYQTAVSTNMAGFALLAWERLYEITGEPEFLQAATKYADWLLSFQVTPPDTPWGDHTYANDSMAVGGFYYGYNPVRHEFGWRVALSLWSAAYSIPGLLLLFQLTSESKYENSAVLAGNWLTIMRYPDKLLIPLQSLSIIKYVFSSWWGLYPQFYQPDMSEVRKAGIPQFVAKIKANPEALLNQNRSWFENTFNVSFNNVDYEMASRGDQYMKMIWSWWPDLGFEPRYGGDIATGAFSMANFLTYNASLPIAQSDIAEIEQLTNNQTSWLPDNVTRSYFSSLTLLQDAQRNFSGGWYSIAVTELSNSTELAEYVLREEAVLAPMNGLRALLNAETVALVALVLVILGLNAYWYRRLRTSMHSTSSRNAKT